VAVLIAGLSRRLRHQFAQAALDLVAREGGRPAVRRLKGQPVMLGGQPGLAQVRLLKP